MPPGPATPDRGARCGHASFGSWAGREPLPVVIQDDANIEVEEAAVWYEARRPGLGLEFVAAVGRVLLDIGQTPERFPLWRSPWRRAVLRRFPYVVFFEIEVDRVVVWAVAHTKRSPGYWVARRPAPRTP